MPAERQIKIQLDLDWLHYKYLPLYPCNKEDVAILRICRS